MGAEMCVPWRRGDGDARYFGLPVSALAVCEQRVVRQSAAYTPGVPIFLQDAAFYWDAQGSAGGAAAVVSADGAWVAAAEREINRFVKRSRLLSFDKYVIGGKGWRKGRGSKSAGRVFEGPFCAIVEKTPLRASHFIALLTLFLSKLPEPLVPPFFARQSETILTNKTVTEEKRAEMLQKATRDTFMSTSPAEYAVFQFLKRLVQRHYGELSAEEVGLFVRSMVREPTEQFVQLIMRQLRPQAQLAMDLPAERKSTDGHSVSGACHDIAPQRPDDGANAEDDVLYSPTGSDRGETAEGGAGLVTENTPTGEVESTTGRVSVGTDVDAGEEEQEKPKEETGHTTLQASTVYSVGSTQRSHFSHSDKAGLIDEDRGKPRPTGTSETEEAADNRVRLDNDECRNVLKVKTAEWREKHLLRMKGKRKEKRSAIEKDPRSTECIDVEVAGSPRTPDVSTLSLLSGRQREFLPEQMKGDTFIDGAGTSAESERSRKLMASVKDFVKSAATTYRSREFFLQHSVSDVDCVLRGSEDEQQQQQQQSLHQPRTSFSHLDSQLSESQVAKPVVSTGPLSCQETVRPTPLKGKESRSGGSKCLIEQHPRYAALMGAKRLFLGEENLPLKRPLCGDGPELRMENSVCVKAHVCNSGPCPLNQRSQAASEIDIDGGHHSLVADKLPLGVESQDNVDDVPHAEGEAVQERMIQLLVTQVQQLSARCEALEQLVKATETPAVPSFQTLQAIKRSEEELARLKNVVREIVESHSATTGNILGLQQHTKQQEERLKSCVVDNQSWFESLLSVKEVALEAQRRCASLEKTQIENRQMCRYISLKMKDLTCKLEEEEKRNLDLKIELSTLQQQTGRMREKLLSGF